MDSPTVPRLFPGSTIFILGSGPSLTAEDVDRLRAYPVIAVNDTYQLAPFAAAIYSSDAKWWHWHPDAVERPGLKYTIQQTKYAAVTTLRARRQAPIETDPHFVATGGHSGYSAINLGVHFGAAQLVLLGYDFQPADDGRHHFFGEHPDRTHTRYAQWQQKYLELIPQLVMCGVTIVNASRRTALLGIPQVTLDSVLSRLAMP
jgi:hypothetical protein